MSATANGVDPALVTRIVDRVKSQGIFDQFRRDCLADVDTKPAYQNLGTRVEGYVSSFLANFVWTPDMNKNQLRNSLRRQINGSEMLASGVERIIEQVVDAQIQQIFLPRIETVVKEYLHSDNAPSSSDNKATENTSAPTQPTQPGGTGSSSSPVVLGVKGSPTDSPLPGWSAATSFPKPPPLPGETQDQPQPPPLPDSTAVQEKPKPPPLPRSREASPPPLPPSSIPERRRTSSVSSTPSLDSISSDPLSIDSEEDKPKEVAKTTPAKMSPASSTKSTPGKTSPGKVAPGKRRVILKKVVVRKADGTKVVRVVRMDPTKATAKKLLMRATARAAGDQGGSPKGKTISPMKDKVEDGKQAAKEGSPAQSIKSEDDLTSDMQISPLLGKRKHLPVDTKVSKVGEAQDLPATKVKDEPTSSGEEKRTSRPIRSKRRGYTREEIAAAQDDSESDEDWTPSPVIPKDEEDSLSKDLEDISSSSSDMDFEEEMNSNYQTNRRDYFPVEASDSESHVSDVTVSSVHTSDLSSFDDKISSSSSSSSSSEEEEDTDDYGKNTGKLEDQSKSDDKPTSLPIPSKDAKDEAPERSVSPASSTGEKTSPRPVAEARWKRQHMMDTEDEETKAERRKRAAEAKEERAKRRQQLKEERERQRESGSSPSQIGTRKQRRGRSGDEGAETKQYTKQQLKEQKLQEKRREAKRQRSLLSQSEDSPAALDFKPRRETKWEQPSILRQEFFLKKRKDSKIPFHHLLTMDMAYKQLLKKSQQRAKYIAMRVKDEKAGKKSYCRFSFQAPGKKARMSRWQQVLAERKKCQVTMEESVIPEAVVETVDMDESDQQVQSANDGERLEVVSPVSPDGTPQIPEKDTEGGLDYEAIKSPETETESIEEIGKNNIDKVDEPEDERIDAVEERSIVSTEKEEDTAIEEEKENETEKAVDDILDSDTTNLKMEEKESAALSTDVVNIVSSEANEEIAGPDNDRDEDERMDTSTTERIMEEECHEEDTKLVTEEGEQLEDSSEMNKEREEDKEQEEDKEEGQINTKDDEKNTESPTEDSVPTFIVLEREEISSEESDFDEPEGEITEEQVYSEEKSLKLPSIFQQTEAISSDEELDDIIPPSAKHKADEDRVEERSEGEVDEDAAPLPEGESITKLTEDISGDELSDSQSLENPPTPTMDEPSEFEGIRDASNDGQAAIPIVLVGNPGGSGKILGHSYSTGSSSDIEGTRTRESTPKDDSQIQEKVKDSKKEEIEEGELAEMEEGEVPEEKEQVLGRRTRDRNLSGQSDPSDDSLGYGKRPRRRTFSPHQGKDDDYLYFGLPKRTRRQSPTQTQSPTLTQGADQKKPLTRERSRSGALTAGQGKNSPTPVKEVEARVPSALTERRSSRYSRRVSPPRRYSPSEQRTAPKSKSQGNITPPLVPSPVPSPSPRDPDPPSQPQQPHRHFTRRMSGRDEERRSHRYEDMYYYDNKKSKSNANQASASGKPTRRTSAEDRKRKR
ncbi:biorientation of chromosomes in cell division protein 1-like 1 isoform X2 [Lytechinus variegatus]|uniref:biorientation of chromosomes in cell division protein 1-like 1 isoform X2 n=1 Tax=Lytechinus variegatus TaxID=7654 RepID=UPI001BB2834B|nr:biorientation of chromosomes in cell division protein 1-like 1 isoform X2 [Lytechinus variegatus]